MRSKAKRAIALIVGAGVLLSVSPLRAQSPDITDMRKDLAQIKADIEVLKRQLSQLIRLVGERQGQAPTTGTGPVRVSVADAPMLGRPDAPVTLVEFSDYQCPFCQRFFATTLPAIKKDYIDTGKVRYVFRDFPLDQIHPQARKAAEAAHCAGDHGRYWEMHDVLYRNQRALNVVQLGEHARKLGLDDAKFAECLSSGRYAVKVSKGLADGTAAGVNGTPGFVVGRTGAGDTVEGTVVRGAQPFDVFRQLIDMLLDQK